MIDNYFTHDQTNLKQYKITGTNKNMIMSDQTF